MKTCPTIRTWRLDISDGIRRRYNITRLSPQRITNEKEKTWYDKCRFQINCKGSENLSNTLNFHQLFCDLRNFL